MSNNTNLVPTIESTSLPSTPAKEWVEKINHTLDAHKLSMPLEARPPPIPGTGLEAGKMQAHPGAERTMFPVSQTKVNPGAAAYLGAVIRLLLQRPTPTPAPIRRRRHRQRSKRAGNLSAEAQAGSLRYLGAGDSSALGTTTQSAENLSTIVHTGTPGSPHPVAPLSRLVESSEKTSIPPTSFSTTVDSNKNKAPVAPLAGSDVLPPPAPRGVLTASTVTPMPRDSSQHLHPADADSSSHMDNPNSHADDDLGDTSPADTGEAAAPHPTRFPERPKGLPVVGKARE
ncbi:hypothetical protein B0H19DRAFT_1082360 [Mycena capillaripes]|nr:hypothetical protein B0H19DRAFT_1082360 [Mycena capillaripes]